MTNRTEPQKIPRRLALVDAGDGMRVEVFALRKRWCFGRWDIYVQPARGVGGRWVREENLEYLEPKSGRRRIQQPGVGHSSEQWAALQRSEQWAALHRSKQSADCERKIPLIRLPKEASDE